VILENKAARPSAPRTVELLVLSALAALIPVGASLGAESTMPSKYVETIKPDLAKQYVYTEDGAYTKALNIPTYEWMPVGTEPNVMILGIHGLTLHGRRFRVIARTSALHNHGFVSLDMRGFGSCYFDDPKTFSTDGEDRKKVDHEKSYEDIVALAKMIKANHPNIPLIAMGESLGCTFCVKLAAEHPELIHGLILSAPAVRLNPDMFVGHGQIPQGVKAFVRHSHELNIDTFFTDLVSEKKEVRDEMVDDPYIRKQLKIRELLSTDKFVASTADLGKSTNKDLSVLILQGNKDGCVSPKHVVDLMNNMPSDDQTLEWKGNFGHLQLETLFVRASVVDGIGNWMRNHSTENEQRMQDLRDCIAGLGATVSH
jgi:alpha-beta hydrolase superfamily lysophospholipase